MCIFFANLLMWNQGFSWGLGLLSALLASLACLSQRHIIHNFPSCFSKGEDLAVRPQRHVRNDQNARAMEEFCVLFPPLFCIISLTRNIFLINFMEKQFTSNK